MVFFDKEDERKLIIQHRIHRNLFLMTLLRN